MRVKTWIVGLVAILAASVLAGCNSKITLPEDPASSAVARAAYDDIAAGRVAAFQARLTPEAAKVVTPEQILSLRPLTVAGQPTTRRLIGTESYADLKGPQTRALTYELVYPGRTVLYSLTLKRPDGSALWRIESCNLNRATEAELGKSTLTLADRSPAQLAFFAATILSPLLMLSALIAVIRAPGLKRKWLWSILALAGIGSATMNWTSGQADFQPFMLNLIGAGVTKQGFSNFFPWVLKFTLPVGAVVAHWRAAKARRMAKAARLDGDATAA